MTSRSDNGSQIRSYVRAECAVFRKTDEGFGGLSNMAAGFPLEVNGLRIPTSEALYQACRFPHMPEVQQLIIGQASPMTAKMKSKPYRRQTRPDWDQTRVKIMRWCLRVKMAQNWRKFGDLLLATGDRPIVEESRKDDFWGAKPVDGRTLIGTNVLGRLLMELREALKSGRTDALARVEPLPIPDFLLAGRPIEPVITGVQRIRTQVPHRLEPTTPPSIAPMQAVQTSLFDRPSPLQQTKPSGVKEGSRQGLTADLKHYRAYKDSGVPWLGEVPEHWEVRRQRNIVRMLVSNIDKHAVEEEIPVRICNYIDVYKRDRITEHVPFMRASASRAEVERFRLRADDVVITKDSETWDDIGVPALVEYEAPDLVCGYHLAILRPIKGVIRGAYLFRALQSWGVASQYYVSANGVTRYGLSHNAIKSILVPLPPLDEQCAIARFLDHVDRRIRRYIRAKLKLIKLLEEQKQAIIHRAVTRGLDPNVRLKPSAVEWLGDVPEHWSVQRTKNLFRLRTQKSGDRHGMELLSIYTHIGVRPRKDLEERGNRASTTDDYWIVRRGDIIVNKLLAWMGAVGVSDFEGVTSPAYDILMPIRELVPEFYHHLFRTKLYLQQFKQRSRGIMDMRLRLYFDQLGQIPLLVPPVEEQSSIAAYYSEATSGLDRTIGTTQREITLLREYRTRLIADVVTGKFDVRELAAGLLEIEEAETQDDVPAVEAATDEDPELAEEEAGADD